MTTIAYRAGILASDSLATQGWAVGGYVRKIGRRGRLLWAGAGSSPLCERFGLWVERGAYDAPPPMGDATDADRHAIGYLFLPDDSMVQFHAGFPPMRIKAPFYAFGSGGPIALGAMAAGKGPAAAVRIAMIWDRGSGGDLQTVRR